MSDANAAPATTAVPGMTQETLEALFTLFSRRLSIPTDPPAPPGAVATPAPGVPTLTPALAVPTTPQPQASPLVTAFNNSYARVFAAPTVTTQQAAPVAHNFSPHLLVPNSGTQNPLAGKSAVARFPTIPPQTIAHILSHSLEFGQLVRLDPGFSRNADRDQPSLALVTGTLSLVDTAPTKFAKISSLVPALAVYFDVLNFDIGSRFGFETGWTISHGGALFIQHLFHLSRSYTWNSILAYTERYYQHRCAEMLEGIYTGWWAMDNQLWQLLRPHSKGEPEKDDRNSEYRKPWRSGSMGLQIA